MTKFKLINPHIEGSLKLTFSGDNSIEAAHKGWKKLSEHCLGNVPKFAFTLENTSDGKLSHFMVQEKEKNKAAKYVITEIDVDSENERNLKKSVKNMNGGKKDKKHKHDDDDDSSSSSSSSSDSDSAYDKIFYKNLRRKTYPINVAWYNPYVYKLDYIVTPTWVAPGQSYVAPTVVQVTDTYVF